jgi:hypothetical protein
MKDWMGKRQLQFTSAMSDLLGSPGDFLHLIEKSLFLFLSMRFWTHQALTIVEPIL